VEETYEDLLEEVKSKVTWDMNEWLIAPFLHEDVKKDLFTIGYFKERATYGMHVEFY
jgi:hypothetical protein